jgi:hypothetical protein
MTFRSFLLGNRQYTVTGVIPAVQLEKGNVRLTLEGSVKFGVYALRLNPVWRPIPSESWDVIGPFPTAFGPQRPVSTVREAMATVYPPEQEFVASAEYQGAGKRRVRWGWSAKREGDHTECGVNFPFRCGMDVTGVGYARLLIDSPNERELSALLGCDWWSNVFLNGGLIRTDRDASEDGAHFCAWKPRPMTLPLHKGENVLLVKCHKGSTMHWFNFYINDAGSLTLRHALS